MVSTDWTVNNICAMYSSKNSICYTIYAYRYLKNYYQVFEIFYNIV